MTEEVEFMRRVLLHLSLRESYRGHEEKLAKDAVYEYPDLVKNLRALAPTPQAAAEWIQLDLQNIKKASNNLTLT